MEGAYHVLFTGALLVFTVLIGVMLARSVIGPRITDRILSINMIGTMVICCIVILSQLLGEDYLADVALIYALISFVSVLIFATVYIPANPGRHFHEHHIEYTRQDLGKTGDSSRQAADRMKRWKRRAGVFRQKVRTFFRSFAGRSVSKDGSENEESLEGGDGK